MKIIGHRGAAGLASQNTLQAIKAGMDAGADMIEFDVRVTSDGVPVLSHDKDVRNGGRSLKVSEHTYDELRVLQSEICTLAQALDLIETKALPLIEVKPGEPVGSIVAVLREFVGGPGSHKMYSWNDLILESKSGKTLVELHKGLPEVPKAVVHAWSGVIASHRARQVDTKYIVMRSWWLWAGFLRAMQRSGFKMIAYTVNDPARARRWQPYLYGVITDYPDRFTGNKPNQNDR